MKKVGIITFHFADNFGAVLQAYALQKAIKKLKKDSIVDIIDFRPKSLTQIYDHSINIKRAIKKYGILNTIGFLWNRVYYFIPVEKRLGAFENFRKRHLIVSKTKYNSVEDLVAQPPEYGYYITGSDQVWNPIYIKYVGYSYFLNFLGDETKKIAYAASIAQTVDNKYIEEYKHYVNKFDYISIREQASLEFLKMLLDKNIGLTMDPTFLLERSEWDKVVKLPSIKEKYILVYGIELNNELVKLANKISEKTDLQIVSYFNKKHFENIAGYIKYKAPDEFLGYLRNAELVLTNSFHGTVFSIIYNKPFYTVPHTVTGSRMVNLLELFGLQDRILYKANDLIGVNYNINYNKVSKILGKEKKYSLEFLKKALEIT